MEHVARLSLLLVWRFDSVSQSEASHTAGSWRIDDIRLPPLPRDVGGDKASPI